MKYIWKYYLNSWIRILRKFIDVQLLKKLPLFYVITSFIIFLKRTHLWILSWCILIQSTNLYRVCFKVHFHIDFPSAPTSYTWTYVLRFSDEIYMHVSHACYIYNPSNIFNKEYWISQIMEMSWSSWYTHLHLFAVLYLVFYALPSILVYPCKSEVLK